jgi:predicted translation initiation factor SUI1
MKLQSLSDLSLLLSDEEKKKFEKTEPKQSKSHDGKGRSLRVYIDRSGRKGKSVTIVAGLQHNPDTMEDIARALKNYCGAGGTVKDGNIEIQGEQIARVKEKLLQMNYAVK